MFNDMKKEVKDWKDEDEVRCYLQDLLDRESPSVFFSQDLCARYFTYARDGETHFVLFDDADTLSQKLRTGGNMGFAAAFLMYPEVQDLLPKLFPGRRT